LVKQFRLPGEAQQIDRILEKFSISFYKQNNLSSLTAETIYILSFSIVMLNTDLHNPSIPKEKKMSISQFIRNNRGINCGRDLPDKFLINLYKRIKNKGMIFFFSFLL
jgi:Sec7-like guanine-nucleotide exchange factor